MNRIRKILMIAIFILMICGINCLAKTGSITTDGLRIRKEPSTKAEIVTVLNLDARVEILNTADGWYQVKYQDYEGYAFGEYVKLDTETVTAENIEDNSQEENNTATESQEDNGVEEKIPTEGIVEEYPKDITTVSTLNVHIVPTMSSTIIYNIEVGKAVKVQEKLNDWLYVQVDNTSGWVRNYNIEVVETQLEADGKVTGGETIEAVNFTTGYINVESANIRKEPNTSSEVLLTISMNTRINSNW